MLQVCNEQSSSSGLRTERAPDTNRGAKHRTVDVERSATNLSLGVLVGRGMVIYLLGYRKVRPLTA